MFSRIHQGFGLIAGAVPATTRQRGFFAKGVKRGPRIRLMPPPRSLSESVDDTIPVGPRISPATSWAYQLQGIAPQTIGACVADIVVMDCTSDGNVANSFTSDQVANMKKRPGGADKKLISYMSIGEAERHRFYWDPRWVRGSVPTAAAPGWMGPLNGEGWNGFKVRFWDHDWQSIIIDRPDSSLNRIIDAGFDGVYLDIVDGYDFWMQEERGRSRRPHADQEMVAFVRRIARHARETRNRPDFLVVPQNGEPLLVYPDYRAAISGLGKEDILYRMDGRADRSPGVKQNPAAEVADIMSNVRLALADRIPVIAVEYLRDRPADTRHIPESLKRMRDFGLVPHFAKRQLDELSPVTLPEDPKMA